MKYWQAAGRFKSTGEGMDPRSGHSNLNCKSYSVDLPFTIIHVFLEQIIQVFLTSMNVTRCGTVTLVMMPRSSTQLPVLIAHLTSLELQWLKKLSGCLDVFH
jgi:hypothetical protein